MTEVLYWTVVEIKPPSVGPAGAFLLSPSFMLIFASSAVFDFLLIFILLENKLIKTFSK